MKEAGGRFALTFDGGQEEQEIPHIKSVLFGTRFYKPRDDHYQGLEHSDSEGRHLAQISHASIEGFEAHFDVVAITTDGASIMLKLGRLLISSFFQVPSSKLVLFCKPISIDYKNAKYYLHCSVIMWP